MPQELVSQQSIMRDMVNRLRNKVIDLREHNNTLQEIANRLHRFNPTPSAEEKKGMDREPTIYEALEMVAADFQRELERNSDLIKHFAETV